MPRTRTIKKGNRKGNRNVSRGNKYTLNRLKERNHKRKKTRLRRGPNRNNYNNLPKRTRKQRAGTNMLRRAASAIDRGARKAFEATGARTATKRAFNTGKNEVLIKLDGNNIDLYKQNFRFIDTSKIGELYVQKGFKEIDFTGKEPKTAGGSVSAIVKKINDKKNIILYLYPTFPPKDNKLRFKFKDKGENEEVDTSETETTGMSDANQRTASRNYIFHAIIDKLKKSDGDSNVDSNANSNADSNKKKKLRDNIRKALLPHLTDTNENLKRERTKAIETASNLNKKYNYNLEEIINYIAGKLSERKDRNIYEIKERSISGRNIIKVRFLRAVDSVELIFVDLTITAKDFIGLDKEKKEIKTNNKIKYSQTEYKTFNENDNYIQRVVVFLNYLDKHYKKSKTARQIRATEELGFGESLEDQKKFREQINKDPSSINELFSSLKSEINTEITNQKFSSSNDEVKRYFIDYVVNSNGIFEEFAKNKTKTEQLMQQSDFRSLYIEIAPHTPLLESNSDQSVSNEDKIEVKYFIVWRGKPKSGPSFRIPTGKEKQLAKYIVSKAKSIKEGELKYFTLYKELLPLVKLQNDNNALKENLRQFTSTLLLSAYNSDNRKYVEIHEVDEDYEILSNQNVKDNEIPISKKLGEIRNTFKNELGIYIDTTIKGNFVINKKKPEDIKIKLVKFGNCKVDESFYSKIGLSEENGELTKKMKKTKIFMQVTDTDKQAFCIPNIEPILGDQKQDRGFMSYNMVTNAVAKSLTPEIGREVDGPGAGKDGAGSGSVSVSAEPLVEGEAAEPQEEKEAAKKEKTANAEAASKAPDPEAAKPPEEAEPGGTDFNWTKRPGETMWKNKAQRGEE